MGWAAAAGWDLAEAAGWGWAAVVGWDLAGVGQEAVDLEALGDAG